MKKCLKSLSFRLKLNMLRGFGVSNFETRRDCGCPTYSHVTGDPVFPNSSDGSHWHELGSVPDWKCPLLATLPEINSSPLKMGHPKRKRTNSQISNAEKMKTKSFKTQTSWTLQMSHEKNPLTFHYSGCLIGILILAFYNPHKTG